MRKYIILIILIFLIPDISYSSFPITETHTISALSEECDNIILNDGNEISAKILEVTPDLVKYKKCSKLDGPTYTLYKNDILLLRYSDGTKDIINNRNSKSSKTAYARDNVNSSFPGLGVASIFFALFGWILLGVVFIPLGLLFGTLSVAIEDLKIPGIIGLALSFIGCVILLIALA